MFICNSLSCCQMFQDIDVARIMALSPRKFGCRILTSSPILSYVSINNNGYLLRFYWNDISRHIYIMSQWAGV